MLLVQDLECFTYEIFAVEAMSNSVQKRRRESTDNAWVDKLLMMCHKTQ
jgi:hypothetical protein